MNNPKLSANSNKNLDPQIEGMKEFTNVLNKLNLGDKNYGQYMMKKVIEVFEFLKIHGDKTLSRENLDRFYSGKTQIVSNGNHHKIDTHPYGNTFQPLTVTFMLKSYIDFLLKYIPLIKEFMDKKSLQTYRKNLLKHQINVLNDNLVNDKQTLASRITKRNNQNNDTDKNNLKEIANLKEDLLKRETDLLDLKYRLKNVQNKIDEFIIEIDLVMAVSETYLLLEYINFDDQEGWY